MFSVVRLTFWYVPRNVYWNCVISSLLIVCIEQDEATGITHHLVPGDFAFFYVGSKVKVCHEQISLSQPSYSASCHLKKLTESFG